MSASNRGPESSAFGCSLKKPCVEPDLADIPDISGNPTVFGKLVPICGARELRAFGAGGEASGQGALPNLAGKRASPFVVNVAPATPASYLVRPDFPAHLFRDRGGCLSAEIIVVLGESAIVQTSCTIVAARANLFPLRRHASSF